MYAVYGGWVPNSPADLLACEEDPHITPAGVTPEWVLSLRAAAAECRAGHPSGLVGRSRCGCFGCNGVRPTRPGALDDGSGPSDQSGGRP